MFEEKIKRSTGNIFGGLNAAVIDVKLLKFFKYSSKKDLYILCLIFVLTVFYFGSETQFVAGFE